MVVAWLGALIGYRQTGTRLTHQRRVDGQLDCIAGSQSPKTGPDSRAKGFVEFRPTTVYASEEVHMSIAKAADILGFGRDQVRTVACDDRLRMEVRALRKRIESDVKEGFRPFCVVASAGTT